MTIDLDDFGADHVISDMCQSHDCRKELDKLHYANQAFKVTLFAIPMEMTPELIRWCNWNHSWVELAFHGFSHSSNYECEKLSYEDFGTLMLEFKDLWEDTSFVKGFKAPGWQISDGAYQWLLDNGWWVADQAYNNDRRPKELPAYVNNNDTFSVNLPSDTDEHEVVEAWHGHTWNCVGNGIEETYDHVENLVKNAKDFQFVSEVLNG